MQPLTMQKQSAKMGVQRTSRSRSVACRAQKEERPSALKGAAAAAAAAVLLAQGSMSGPSMAAVQRQPQADVAAAASDNLRDRDFWRNIFSLGKNDRHATPDPVAVPNSSQPAQTRAAIEIPSNADLAESVADPVPFPTGPGAIRDAVRGERKAEEQPNPPPSELQDPPARISPPGAEARKISYSLPSQEESRSLQKFVVYDTFTAPQLFAPGEMVAVAGLDQAKQAAKVDVPNSAKAVSSKVAQKIPSVSGLLKEVADPNPAAGKKAILDAANGEPDKFGRDIPGRIGKAQGAGDRVLEKAVNATNGGNKNLRNLRDAASDAFNTASDAGTRVGDKLNGDSVVEKAAGATKDAGDKIKRALSNATASAPAPREVFMVALSNPLSGSSNAVDAVTDAADSAASDLSSAASSLKGRTFDRIFGGKRALKGAVVGGLKGAAGDVGASAKDATRSLQSSVKDAGRSTNSALKGLQRDVSNDAARTGDRTADKLSGAADRAGNKVSRDTSFVSNKAGGARNRLVKNANSAGSDVQSLAKDSNNRVQGAAQDAGGAIAGAARDVQDSVVDLAGGLKRAANKINPST